MDRNISFIILRIHYHLLFICHITSPTIAGPMSLLLLSMAGFRSTLSSTGHIFRRSTRIAIFPKLVGWSATSFWYLTNDWSIFGHFLSPKLPLTNESNLLDVHTSLDLKSLKSDWSWSEIADTSNYMIPIIFMFKRITIRSVETPWSHSFMQITFISFLNHLSSLF